MNLIISLSINYLVKTKPIKIFAIQGNVFLIRIMQIESYPL